MRFESHQFRKYCALETTGRLKIDWNILEVIGRRENVPDKNHLSQCLELFLTKPEPRL